MKYNGKNMTIMAAIREYFGMTKEDYAKEVRDRFTDDDYDDIVDMLEGVSA